ncbi:hypothetical protein [Streptomyces sp. bgisy029]|uniref:hypothetical protein n=1 Tax=Streptomyces sp. bgisy029 TaxID=3413771 RepID=UPI003D7101CF
MISEPELVGELGPEHRPEAVGGVDHRPPPGRRRGHGLLWALAGALTASAIWAAAVFAYGDDPERKPDMHGYELGGRSCSAMQMKALTASVGKRYEAPSLSPGRIGHPAFDSISCSMAITAPKGTGPDEEWTYSVSVGMSVELHKETDPLPEFEARRNTAPEWGEDTVRSELVPGLGDRAYLLVASERTSELRVVEGGAVIMLSISANWDHQGYEDGTEPSSDAPDDSPDVEPYHADLISDMRDVMKALKTAA